MVTWHMAGDGSLGHGSVLMVPVLVVIGERHGGTNMLSCEYCVISGCSRSTRAVLACDRFVPPRANSRRWMRREVTWHVGMEGTLRLVQEE